MNKEQSMSKEEADDQHDAAAEHHDKYYIKEWHVGSFLSGADPMRDFKAGWSAALSWNDAQIKEGFLANLEKIRSENIGLHKKVKELAERLKETSMDHALANHAWRDLEYQNDKLKDQILVYERMTGVSSFERGDPNYKYFELKTDTDIIIALQKAKIEELEKEIFDHDCNCIRCDGFKYE